MTREGADDLCCETDPQVGRLEALTLGAEALKDAIALAPRLQERREQLRSALEQGEKLMGALGGDANRIKVLDGEVD